MTAQELSRPSSSIDGGGPTRTRVRTLIVGLFVVYLVLLAWVVLWKLQAPYVGEGGLRQVKFVPFVPSAGFGASAPAEVLANFLLFLPFGLYLGMLAPAWSWQRATAAMAAASLALEVSQYLLIVGSADVTDLIVNTAGGLAGLGLIVQVRRRLAARTTTFLVWMCSVGTVIALLAGGAFIASPLHYAPLRDVIVRCTPGASAHSADETGNGDRDRSTPRCEDIPH